MSSADYVVVGAGSAGCVLAARLSEDKDASVILLEAGGDADSPDVHEPAHWPLLWNTSVNWAYMTTSQPGFGYRAIPYPRGKGLGGTSAINAMIYARGEPRDYDNWQAGGNPGWGWKEVLPYFRRIEDHPLGPSEFHGSGGPLGIEAPNLHASSRAFIEAAMACGHPLRDDFNGAGRRGVGPWHVTIRHGKRCSAAAAYLRPSLSRSNLRVVKHAHVLRIDLIAGRATGVSYFDGRGLERAEARREVILCAGAIDSPKLLMLSGIGDPQQLERHGIKVAQPLVGVGANLHDHAATPLVLARRQPSTAEPSSNLADAGLYMRASPADDGYETDIQMFFSPLVPVSLATRGQAPAMAINVQPCRPISRGSLTLRSSNPLDAPVIHPGYLTHPADVAIHLEGIKAARQIAHTAPLSEHVTGEVLPGSAATSAPDLERAVRAAAGCVWHPVGTCRMGAGPDAVVDAQLRVHGLRGLRVVDGSVMPQIPSGNTNAPIIMIAERASDFIRGRHA